MLLAYMTISKIPTAASIEVSLYSKMNSLVIVGMTRLTVCGMMTKNIV